MDSAQWPWLSYYLAAGKLTANTKNRTQSHQNEVKKYNLTINTKAALKQKIASSAKTKYLMGICDNDTEFAGVLARIMMDSLYTKHGNTKC